jgi:single-stranded-DNA-specific exonuclease
LSPKDYKAPRPWKARELADNEALVFNELKRETGLSPITLRVCLARGLTTALAIKDHLNPKFEQLHHPHTIEDMEIATARLSEAREAGEKIRIFGDYDVDGTTGAALLFWVFREFGFDADVRQPDRFKDGYGLNVGAVEEAHAQGITLMVTVDCGITSFAAIERANELQIDVIVVDHHQLDATHGMPPAMAVLNPQRPDCGSGLKELCGCGLAFYLAMALRIRGREEGWFLGKNEPNLKQHLDLVVLATAADMVPLTGDNHILVRQGMEVLKNTRKPGFRALLDAAGVGQKDLSPGHLGFVLGPRINASGRMQSASLALELLTTTDAARGARLALELEKLNTERADLQNQIWEVKARVEEGIAQGKFEHGVVVADAGWHEGVVGIVASRVTETFRRPAAVISIREDFAKGSVRSFGGKDVLQALRDSAEHLLGFGGHKHAAGLSLKPENIEALQIAFNQALALVKEDTLGTPLLVEGQCEIQDLDLKTLQEIENLGPFGPGNPEPVFTFKASVLSHRVLKERHLKLQLGSSDQVKTIEAIWFHAAQERDIEGPEFSGASEWAGVPELNRFRGQATPTVRVRDWRPLTAASI